MTALSKSETTHTASIVKELGDMQNESSEPAADGPSGKMRSYLLEYLH